MTKEEDLLWFDFEYETDEGDRLRFSGNTAVMHLSCHGKSGGEIESSNHEVATLTSDDIAAFSQVIQKIREIMAIDHWRSNNDANHRQIALEDAADQRRIERWEAEGKTGQADSQPEPETP